MLPEYVEKTIIELEEKALWHCARAILFQSEANNIRALLDPTFILPHKSEPPASEDELKAMVTTPIEEIRPEEPELPKQEPQQPATEPEQEPPLRRRASAEDAESKNCESGFYGVYKGRLSPNRGRLWRAIVFIDEYYSNGKRKRKCLGESEIPELAAAKVQEYLGNKVEAERLYEIGRQKLADWNEQKENNPDRPPKKKYASVIWECNKCCHQHIVTRHKPEKCEQCGCENLKRIA